MKYHLKANNPSEYLYTIMYLIDFDPFLHFFDLGQIDWSLFEREPGARRVQVARDHVVVGSMAN